MSVLILESDYEELLRLRRKNRKNKKLQEKYKDYKQRIDKAVEYINIFKNDIRGIDEIVLLNILQNGSDDNE